MPTRTPHDALVALLDGVAAGRWDELAELYAPDAVVRHPFARDASALLTGREALRAHFARLGSAGLHLHAREPVVTHETGDPEVLIAEFTYAGTDGAGRALEMAACFVWRVRDGLVVESRDYLDRPRLLDVEEAA